ncbi:MAG: 16S rRNA (cytosine(967)-C(5))-methyltransferase RsmB [Chitinivibrionales bacterium]|nr:16S rRNA (cytosine(967)-C(5))-methyltransferase RsmB [Chitinivibrionales bacterium]
MKPRQIVYSILEDFTKYQGNLDVLIAEKMKDITDHRDRRFIYELTFGIFRNMRSLDYAIVHFMEAKPLQSNVDLMNILRIGAYQILYMDRVPDHAAVNEAVKASKRNFATRKYSGLINALLRNLIAQRRKPPLPDPKNVVERLSVEFSQPLWMVERWLKRYGLQKTKKLLVFFNTKPDIYLRKKIRGLSKVQFEQEVRAFSVPSGGYKNLYYKINKQKPLQYIDVINEGYCVIQSPSSGWVVALLDIVKGDHILDLCSAPGGKASLIAELAEEDGSVCTCDSNLTRLRSVKGLKRRMNLRRIFPLCCDGRHIPIKGYFDKVLLDVPCSGAGVLHRHPDARWRKTKESLARMAQIQEALLETGAAMVQPGGIVVYSTCSLEPEENEMVVEKFLENNPHYVQEPCPVPIPATYTDLSGYLRILPHEHNLDGMFGARLKRLR